MWFVLLAVAVLLIAAVVAATVPRGRRTRYRTVEERPAGRD